VDWAKVDAPLASALAGAEEDDEFTVFVHVDAERADVATLERLRLVGAVSTASLRRAELAALTDEPCVRQIRLARRLRLLDDDW
jgi:hypothetical protein